MKKSDIARQYRDEHGWDIPTLKLARIMYAENNLTFKDIEDARMFLRYIEGKHGPESRKFKTIIQMPERPKNPYNLPESHQEKREPFILPKVCNNILLISDLHIPYHDIDAITIALDYGKKENVNTIFINGDLIDNSQVSRFEKDMKKRSVKQEFDATKEFLVQLRAAFPDASIYWLKGNHCYIDGTEVLTKDGFKDFKSLSSTDLVAQFDADRVITYAHPDSIIRKNYKGLMYDIDNGFSRQVVTHSHDVIVGNKKIKAKDITQKHLKEIVSTGTSNNEDYPISDALLKFIVNLVCDGTIVLDKKYGDGKMRFQFKISKQRKIDNLTAILDELGYAYTVKEATKSGLNKLQPFMIRLYNNKTIKPIYELLNGKKEFPSFFKLLSERQAKIVIEEIKITDGVLKDGGVFWTTTSKNDIDTIQLMCLHNNIFTCLYDERFNNSGFANGKLQYFMKIRYSFSHNSPKKIDSFEYDGEVHCVEMPLGSVVTRYNGRIAFSGNCVRWEKFLEQKVREIWDDPYFHLEERLRLNEQNIKLLDDTVLVKAGKLSITHGHHIFKGIFVPVSPARGAFMRAKQSVIVGHLHRSSYHTEMDLDGKVIGCWSTACLCELRPNYSPLVSNSQHGFAHITIDKTGDFTVKNYQIINGKLH